MIRRHLRNVMASAMAVEKPDIVRLLGYPQGHACSEEVEELIHSARQWYAENGRPWVCMSAHRINSIASGEVRLDCGSILKSETLSRRFDEAGVDVAVAAGISAGDELSREVHGLWQAGRPDAAFVLDSVGSAIAEQLVQAVRVQLCEDVEEDGYGVLSHYSPGYAGWSLDDQRTLFALLRERESTAVKDAAPDAIEVLESGALRPPKSLLALFGCTPRHLARGATRVPCRDCTHSPCTYRRAPFESRSVSEIASAVPAETAARKSRRLEQKHRRDVLSEFAFPEKALSRWSRDHLTLSKTADGSVHARFLYHGTTCTNLGVPVTIPFDVDLVRTADKDYIVARASYSFDEELQGFRAMCAYLTDPNSISGSSACPPLEGQRLSAALDWHPEVTPSGCVCSQTDRDHKWRIVLQTILYALSAPVESTASQGSDEIRGYVAT